jgi:cell division protein FtsZ
MLFEILDTEAQEAIIKVAGVGGCGGNAIDHMVDGGVEGVEFIAMNTDSQDLKRSRAGQVLQMGGPLTRGLGAGANPAVGREAALADRERISEMIDGADLLFITAGMGGGTGTGAAPVIAEVAREKGILTVAVVTKPFGFEGRRIKIAQEGVRQLAELVDSLIVIPNEKLLSVLGPDVTQLEAFRAANDVLLGAVAGISEVIKRPGLVNVDFADVRTVMSEMGMAMMGSAISAGQDRANVAAQQAIASPLLEDVNLSGARGVLVNITATSGLKLREVDEVMKTIRSFTAEDATVIYGTVVDEEMGEDLRVTIVATGLGALQAQRRTPIFTVVEPNAPAATPASEASVERPLPGMRSGREAFSGSAEADTMPPVIRSGRGQAPAGTGEDPLKDPGMDHYDIPAFLRKQMD